MKTNFKEAFFSDQAGFNLTELLIVLVIIGILASLALPAYTKTKERALDKEAQTALRLIQAGEKLYFLRNDNYYPNSNINSINQTLQLGLPSNNPNWDYGIINVSSATFTATASRAGNFPSGWNRTWQIDSFNIPWCSGTNCP